MNHQGQLTNVFYEYLRLIILKTYGDRAFSVAAPRLWNALSMDIKLSLSVSVFKNTLKTHFFRAIYFLCITFLCILSYFFSIVFNLWLLSNIELSVYTAI